MDALREVIAGAYRIIYSIGPSDTVEILMIAHGARLLDDLPQP